MDKVVELTAAVRTKYKRSKCQHNVVSIDPETHACECTECGEGVSATWFLIRLAGRWEMHEREFERSEQQRKEIDAYKPYLKAVKKLEHTWRGKMLPTCPHCRKPIEAQALAASWRIRKEGK